MATKEEETLERIIIDLADGMNREAMENNAGKVQELHKRFARNEGLYDASAAVALDNFAMILAEPFLSAHGVTDRKRRNVAEWLYGQQLPHFIRQTVNQKEGWMFSGDKEHYIIRKIKQYIITGENQILNNKDFGQKGFWETGCFRDTDDVLEQFQDWYLMRNLGESK